MVNVLWKDSVVDKKVLYFDDIEVNQAFRNISDNSRGAIYIKVHNSNSRLYYMLEIVSGILWTPTASPIELINVDIRIDAPKPSIY